MINWHQLTVVTYAYGNQIRNSNSLNYVVNSSIERKHETFRQEYPIFMVNIVILKLSRKTVAVYLMKHQYMYINRVCVCVCVCVCGCGCVGVGGWVELYTLCNV